MGGGIWILKGVFHGSSGVLVDVRGRLTTGNRVALGTGGKIRCNYQVTLDDGVGLTEETQVFDTNFHFTQNIETGEVRRWSDKIHLSECCWVGNRTTIAKGTVLPPYTLVCSNSLVNKDFSDCEVRCPMIGGTPAKLIGGGFHRIYNFKLEDQLKWQFNNDPTLKCVTRKVEPIDAAIDTEHRNPDNWKI